VQTEYLVQIGPNHLTVPLALVELMTVKVPFLIRLQPVKVILLVGLVPVKGTFQVEVKAQVKGYMAEQDRIDSNHWMAT
jgi:hypothetical protein